MKNKELIYELAKKLDMVIEVYKKGEYVGRFKFIDDKLNKLKENKKDESQRSCRRNLH